MKKVKVKWQIVVALGNSTHLIGVRLIQIKADVYEINMERNEKMSKEKRNFIPKVLSMLLCVSVLFSLFSMKVFADELPEYPSEWTYGSAIAAPGAVGVSGDDITLDSKTGKQIMTYSTAKNYGITYSGTIDMNAVWIMYDMLISVAPQFVNVGLTGTFKIVVQLDSKLAVDQSKVTVENAQAAFKTYYGNNPFYSDIFHVSSVSISASNLLTTEVSFNDGVTGQKLSDYEKTNGALPAKLVVMMPNNILSLPADKFVDGETIVTTDSDVTGTINLNIPQGYRSSAASALKRLSQSIIGQLAGFNFNQNYIDVIHLNVDSEVTESSVTLVRKVKKYNLTYKIEGERPVNSEVKQTLNIATETDEGATVDMTKATTTDTTNSDGKTGTWSFEWKAEPVLATGNKMPASDVTVTGTWTFKKDTPNTGDVNNMSLWMLLGAVSALSMGSVVVLRKKKEE